MRLHNQTGHALVWSDGGVEIRWEPYGAAEVAQEFVEHLAVQRFPVGPAPVSQEAVAAAAIRAAEEAARDDGTRKLRVALDEREKALIVLRAEVADAKRALDVQRDECVAVQAKLASMELRAQAAEAERDALRSEVVKIGAQRVAAADDATAAEAARVSRRRATTPGS